MTQKNKDLLQKDLCARLPYGVIVRVFDEEYGNFDSYIENISNTCVETNPVNERNLDFNPYVFYRIEDVKPYLRPLSTMTREEKEYAEELSNFSCTPDVARRKIDFYLENHLDFRGLIEKGLAIKVTKKNNPYKI